MAPMASRTLLSRHRQHWYSSQSGHGWTIFVVKWNYRLATKEQAGTPIPRPHKSCGSCMCLYLARTSNCPQSHAVGSLTYHLKTVLVAGRLLGHFVDSYIHTFESTGHFHRIIVKVPAWVSDPIILTSPSEQPSSWRVQFLWNFYSTSAGYQLKAQHIYGQPTLHCHWACPSTVFCCTHMQFLFFEMSPYIIACIFAGK